MEIYPVKMGFKEIPAGETKVLAAVIVSHRLDLFKALNFPKMTLNEFQMRYSLFIL